MQRIINLATAKRAHESYEGFIPLDQIYVHERYLKTTMRGFNFNKLNKAIFLYKYYGYIKPLKLYQGYEFYDSVNTLIMALMMKMPSVPYRRVNKQCKYNIEQLKRAVDLNLGRFIIACRVYYTREERKGNLIYEIKNDEE